jgi:hypothetical protein
MLIFLTKKGIYMLLYKRETERNATMKVTDPKNATELNLPFSVI